MKHVPNKLQNVAVQALRWKAERPALWGDLVTRLKQRFPGLDDDQIEARITMLAVGVPV